MADPENPKADVSAEKAYAAASEAITDKPIEIPAKPKRGRKPAGAGLPAASTESAAPEPAAPEPVAAEPVAPEPVAPEPVAPEPVAPEPVAAEPVVVAAPPADSVAAVKPVPKPRRSIAVANKPPVKLVVKRTAATPAAIKPRKPAIQKIKTAPKTAKTSPSATQKPPLLTQLKEIPMDMTATVTEAVSGAQEKAKEAFTKTTAAFGEYGEFAKGNVEALVESGKILATGLQDLGSKFVSDTKAVLETTVADVKELTSVKSPTDFFKLQTEMLRRNFDSAVSYSSKTSEAMLKLTNEVIAPISGRVTLAVDKIRKAA